MKTKTKWMVKGSFGTRRIWNDEEGYFFLVNNIRYENYDEDLEVWEQKETKTFICSNKRPNNEVIQDAIDWVDKGTEEKPRFAFVTKQSSGENSFCWCYTS